MRRRRSRDLPIWAYVAFPLMRLLFWGYVVITPFYIFGILEIDVKTLHTAALLLLLLGVAWIIAWLLITAR